MKKVFIGVIILFFCITVATAQSISVGVRGGISIPNLKAGYSRTNPVNTGYSSILGPDAGVFAEIKISDVFSVQPMLEYSSQGGKKNGLQAFPTPAEAAIYFNSIGEHNPPYLYANFKNKIQLNYLMLPVLAKFGFSFNNPALRLYADAGPFAGLLLKAKDITSGSSEIYTDAAGQMPLPLGVFPLNGDMNVKDSLNKWNAGIEGNIGLQYQFGQSNIFIEGGGNYGLKNIQKGAANGKNNTGAATVTIGYSYAFGE